MMLFPLPTDVSARTGTVEHGSASQRQQLVTSDGQTRLGVNDQELRPCGAMRQSVAGKDVNTEAEESTALGAVTRRQQVKTQQAVKTLCVL
jgi:hypothetical protein